MTNRSDRRALTLILPKVFSETVDLIRRARANFHRGPEEQFFHEEAESMTATIVLNPGKNLLHFSGGTIYGNRSGFRVRLSSAIDSSLLRMGCLGNAYSREHRWLFQFLANRIYIYGPFPGCKRFFPF